MPRVPAFLVLLCLVLTGFGSSAHAYIPPSAFLVKSFVKKHASLKNAKVRSQVVGLVGDKPSGTSFKTLTIVNAQTGTIRSWAQDEAGSPLYAMERRDRKALPLPALLLLDGNPRVVLGALEAKGVPIRGEEELSGMKDEEERRASEVESLARWKNTVAWVIGDRAKTGASQLWIEKDTFLPLRLIYPGSEAEAMMDVQLETYRYYGDTPFPRQVTLSRKSAPVLREDLIEFSHSPNAVELRMPVTQGYTEAGNAAPAELRDLIRHYYETLR